MLPIKFKGFTTILNAPKNWDAEKNGECLGLPIARAHGFVVSCWKPTLIERIKLIFGKPITLYVAGDNQQPVCLEVKTPNE